MALTIQPLIATTTILTIATTTILSGPHSNTNIRLYILRNIYRISISIKETYSFLKIGKQESIKYVLVVKRIYVFYNSKIRNNMKKCKGK